MTAFWTETKRDFVHVSGADALTYLQSQISQDIRGLADGASAYTFVLQPTGKIDALARIVRHTADEFLIDTDPDFGESLIARLNRFKIRVKVEITPLAWRCVAIRNSARAIDHAVLAWGLADAFDLLGDDPRPPSDMREGSSMELERARISAGWPAMGREITDASIPAETGVAPEAVNFTKGCYPGQELVERMDSRGSQAPRFVRSVRSTDPLAVGDEIVSDSIVVGHVTSAIQEVGDQSGDQGGLWIGLGVVARSAQPGDVVRVRGNEITLRAARD